MKLRSVLFKLDFSKTIFGFFFIFILILILIWKIRKRM
ncbi:hypothetical protein CHCC15075_1920 [Bacillus licheniformis]|uniref:Uncharacterized protein n=1 Tax=Bacillus licheniformis TaxID=1402 RepID=A0A8B5Y867_BACLI|nr:hypothetical protein B4092_2946 [Bacillus licheniformis]KYC80981.1 hypothetical protein B4091_3000 [Bacillus licheniformis]KYC96408.1 hypothetical protein B4164_2853 [Bacillus licheniformis]TWK52879.1 hypothetical protein CHCC20345_2880 [Bacillus licheniformis]TWK69912.1 hypothetical protein CHCC20339_2095 [Bacillus licheniformis]